MGTGRYCNRTRTVITDGLRHSTSRAAALHLATLMLEWFQSTTLTQVTTDYCKSSQLFLLEIPFTFSTTDSTVTELKSSPSRMHFEYYSLCSSNASEGNQNVHTHTHGCCTQRTDYFFTCPYPVLKLAAHFQFTWQNVRVCSILVPYKTGGRRSSYVTQIGEEI